MRVASCAVGFSRGCTRRPAAAGRITATSGRAYLFIVERRQLLPASLLVAATCWSVGQKAKMKARIRLPTSFRDDRNM